MGDDCPDKEFLATLRNKQKKTADLFKIHYESHYKRYRGDGSKLTELSKNDVQIQLQKKMEAEAKENERL